MNQYNEEYEKLSFPEIYKNDYLAILSKSASLIYSINITENR